MIDTDAPDTARPVTAKLLRLSQRATAQIAPLIDILEPLARSRPDAPVAADLLVLARRALRAAAPVTMALDAPPPLPLHPPVTHAGLAARLAQAAQQARLFRRRLYVSSDPLDAIAWHIEKQVLAVAQGAEAEPKDERAGFR